MKKSVIYSAIFLLIFCCGNLRAEDFELTNWKTISAYSDVTSLAADTSGHIWCGANGGISVVNYKDTTAETIYLNDENGMTDFSISALAYCAKFNRILAGTSSGTMQSFSCDSLACTVNTDINRSNFSNSSINKIIIRDGLAWLACGFGIAVYDPARDIYTESVTKISDFNKNTGVNDIMFKGDTVFAATDAGIAFALTSSILQNPGSWTAVSMKNLSGTEHTAKLLATNGSNIYAIIDSSLYEVGSELRFIKKYDYYRVFNSLQFEGGRLLLTDQFYICDTLGNSIELNHPLYNSRTTYINSTAYISAPDGSSHYLVFAYKENGAGICRTDENYNPINGKNLYLPNLNSPLRRNYSDISCDRSGNLWLATGSSAAAKGFSVRTAAGKWINRNMNNDNRIEDDAYFRVYPLSDGRVCLANWGKGMSVCTLSGDSVLIQNYDTKNSPLTGYNGSGEYTIGSGMSLDSYGALWFVNVLGIAGSPILIKMDKSGNFSTYDYPSTFTANRMLSMAIDGYGTKWLSSDNDDGLVYFNTDKGISGKYSTAGTNLTSNTINSLAIDASGMLWLGTSKGLNVMFNPSAVLGTSTPVIRNVTALAGQLVNQIYIDAIDNKWIATNAGVFVLSSDGSTILANYTTKNSPLESDEINSITSDITTGKIYIATASGIQYASSLSIEPRSTYDISCYPQPFDPSKDERLTIDGLSGDNTLKIVTSEGRYVRTVTAEGGRAVWDGLDKDGNRVSTGIYLILASSGSMNNAHGVGKIAVKYHN